MSQSKNQYIYEQDRVIVSLREAQASGRPSAWGGVVDAIITENRIVGDPTSGLCTEAFVKFADLQSLKDILLQGWIIYANHAKFTILSLNPAANEIQTVPYVKYTPFLELQKKTITYEDITSILISQEAFMITPVHQVQCQPRQDQRCMLLRV